MVRIYAYESNKLNVLSAALFDKISKYYLKDSGVVMFGFSNFEQLVDINAKSLVAGYDELLNMHESEFASLNKRYPLSRNISTDKLTENSNSATKSHVSTWAFGRENFALRIDEISKKLENLGFYLKNVNFYNDYFEKI
ncbi:MAG: hypothetical protein ACTTJC_08970 [Campylobacter sp.]